MQSTFTPAHSPIFTLYFVLVYGVIENEDAIEAPVMPPKQEWDDEDAEDDDIKVSLFLRNGQRPIRFSGAPSLGGDTVLFRG